MKLAVEQVYVEPLPARPTTVVEVAFFLLAMTFAFSLPFGFPTLLHATYGASIGLPVWVGWVATAVGVSTGLAAFLVRSVAMRKDHV